MGAAIASVGVSVPATTVPNAAISARLGVSDNWISAGQGSATGISQDRTSVFATYAAEAGTRALERAGADPAELDMVLVATTTADELLPNAAPLVAHALGATHAGAFDIGAACTGFLSALAVGSAQVEAGRARTVLVVGADLMSRITDPSDRSTAAVFADGAGDLDGGDRATGSDRSGRPGR